MRVLVTGNTGFKGTWLSIYLSMLGHEVHGYSLDYHPGGLNYQLDPKQWLSSQRISDIRDKEQLRKTLQSVKPELVFHLAAQPIVLDSIKDPVNTFDINVNGTLNILEQAKSTSSVQKVLVVTSDKVYDQSANKGKPSKELDRLGGKDPYSYSKVCQDLVAQSFYELGEGPQILIARAGNVLGGFDKGKYRLLPDAINSIQTGRTLNIRSAKATRPWQHVLDCVRGYINYSLAAEPPPVLNFGPNPIQPLTVEGVLQIVKSLDNRLNFAVLSENSVAETRDLVLDSSLAKSSIKWQSLMDIDSALTHSMMELDRTELSKKVFSSVAMHIGLEEQSRET